MDKHFYADITFFFLRMYSDSPFASWTSDHIQEWLRDEGLEEYVSACAKSVKKGEDLLKFTFSDYERELGITDPMHKRKLSLALKVINFRNFYNLLLVFVVLFFQ